MMEKDRPDIGLKITSLWKKFAAKKFRHAFSSARIGDSLALQIHTLRTHRNWTQSDLAERADMKQPRISTMEDSCDGVSISTLKKLAEAFDVALCIKFVSFSKLAEESIAHSADINIDSYDDDHPKCIDQYDAVLSSVRVEALPVQWAANSHTRVVPSVKPSFTGTSGATANIRKLERA